MESRVDVARQQWAHSYRVLGGGPSGLDGPLREQVAVVTAELRRRIGDSFTLNELAAAYDGSERWVMAALSERCARPGWVRTAATAADAAFHLYARGARDYRP
ncbi:MAG TPA: hypothetical protein VFR32_05260 [Gaiellaceae bacterium]|nr:hypothetical protein [Gaiellaceae bacterium]